MLERDQDYISNECTSEITRFLCIRTMATMNNQEDDDEIHIDT